jgi:hypothetical protein
VSRPDGKICSPFEHTLGLEIGRIQLLSSNRASKFLLKSFRCCDSDLPPPRRREISFQRLSAGRSKSGCEKMIIYNWTDSLFFTMFVFLNSQLDIALCRIANT